MEAEPKYDSHVTTFVNWDFYVVDVLTSCPTSDEAIKILRDTQNALMEYGNSRLHKIVSNSLEVMAAIPSSDLATSLKDLDPDVVKPLQRSLGMSSDVNKDIFFISTILR